MVQEFVSAPPATSPVEFALTGIRTVTDEDGTPVLDDDGQPVLEDERQEFAAVPALSFGVLLNDLVNSGGDAQQTLAFFDRALVADDRERFQAFLTDPDLYFDRPTVVKLAQWISEQQGAGVNGTRPTGRPAASRSTRRSGGRGSTAGRSKAASGRS